MNEFERLQNGIEKFGKIATIQVDWRMSNHGKDIERDNDAIWGGFLHRLSNDDWLDILTVFPMIVDHHGVFLKTYQENGYKRTCEALEQQWETPRCLDINKGKVRNKPVQWQMIMIIREVYESINNVQYPKVPQSTTVPRPQFTALFEQSANY